MSVRVNQLDCREFSTSHNPIQRRLFFRVRLRLNYNRKQRGGVAQIAGLRVQCFALNFLRLVYNSRGKSTKPLFQLTIQEEI